MKLFQVITEQILAIERMNNKRTINYSRIEILLCTAKFIHCKNFSIGKISKTAKFFQPQNLPHIQYLIVLNSILHILYHVPFLHSLRLRFGHLN